MGVAVVNLSHRTVHRIPPRHFLICQPEQARSYAEDLAAGRLVAREVPEHRRIGPMPLRGRYDWLAALAAEDAAAQAAAGSPAAPAETAPGGNPSVDPGGAAPGAGSSSGEPSTSGETNAGGGAEGTEDPGETNPSGGSV